MAEAPQEAKRNDEVKRAEELKKLINIASDLEFDPKIRVQAIELLGKMRTHESLLALLGLAGNDKLNIEDRELALKHAREIIKSGR